MNISIREKENASDFVLGQGGFKYADLEPYMNKKGYVNFDLLKGKEGGYYLKISAYGVEANAKAENTENEQIPF